MKKFKRSINNFLLFILPKNRVGDFLFDLIHFFVAHKRLPLNKNLFSDYLFRLKNSSNINNEELRSYVCDKELVKFYASNIISEKYIVKTIHILKNEFEVDQYNFPVNCCIKPTHLSGRVIFRKNGNKIDINEIKSWLKINYYKLGREKTYKSLIPKIIIEELIFNSTNNKDYKFFCYKGKVAFIQIDLDRFKEHKRLYLNSEWEILDFSMIYPKYEGTFNKPDNFFECNLIAEKLSKDFEFIRIDLYTNGERIFLGEMTNFPENLRGNFIPRNSEKIISEIFFGL